MKREWFCLRRVIAGCVLVLMAGAPVGGVAQAAWSGPGEVTGAKDLPAAWRAYEENDYESARSLAAGLIARGQLVGKDLSDAWVLKGLCETDLGNHDGAVQSFLQGIRLNPDARVEGAAFIPREIANFNEAMALWRKETSGTAVSPIVPPQPPPDRFQSTGSAGKKSLLTRPVFFVPAGIIVGGVIALLAGGGGQDASPLPGLPAHP